MVKVSSYADIIKRVEEKYESLGGLEKGLIAYFNIALDGMFNMSDIVITSIQEFFKNFSWDGVANYTSENMALPVQNINAVAERLAELLSLPRYTPLLILTGFTKFSVPKFVGPFELILNNEMVIQLYNDVDRYDYKKFFEKVKKLALLSSNSFPSLKFSNHWNIRSNHWHDMAKVKGPCDNCGR